MIRSSYFEKSVSRETLLKLTKYHEFLIENNKKISLISKNTEKIAVKRHYEDCAQLIKYIDKTDKTILDVGTGAGLPGIILEIIKNDHDMSFSTHLVEKSPKKGKFLKKANLTNAMNYYNQAISIPIFYKLSNTEQKKIINIIKKLIKK